MQAAFKGAFFCVTATILTACSSGTAQLPPAAGTAGAAIPATRNGPHYMKALFYAFGGNSGKMAIIRVSYSAWPHLDKLINIPYKNLFGACSDTAGNVFVTQHGSSGSGAVIEFAHAGTTAIATLSDSGMATACAYDRSTGNLAVANSYDADAPGGPGPDIAIYSGETGKPTLYPDPLADSIGSCTYDLSGNLYIGGVMRHGHFVLMELPHSSPTIESIAISGKIGAEYRLEDVHWHKGSLMVTSIDHHHSHSTHVFVLDVSGTTATLKATIKLHTVNGNEKARTPWTAVFGRYVVTTDRIGISGFILPDGCVGTCYIHRGERHLDRIAPGFTSVTASVIRPREGQ